MFMVWVLGHLAQQFWRNLKLGELKLRHSLTVLNEPTRTQEWPLHLPEIFLYSCEPRKKTKNLRLGMLGGDPSFAVFSRILPHGKS